MMNPLPSYPSRELQLRREKSDDPMQYRRKNTCVIYVHHLSVDREQKVLFRLRKAVRRIG